MDQWNRGEALKAPAAAPAPKADATEGERTTAIDAAQPTVTAPIQARGFAWSNISAAQGIGEPKVANAAFSIADVHERSMSQAQRVALAAVPAKTAP
jgi:hypothetical protein